MTFKQFLNEAPSYYRDIEEHLANSRFPIIEQTMENLGYGENVVAFHAMNSEYLMSFKKLQNTKKTISAFTEANLNKLIKSITTKPDLIVKIEGYAVADFEADIMSHPDKQGKRWIKTRDVKKSKFIQEALQKGVIELLMGDEYTFEDILYDDILYKKLFKGLSSKDKKLAIQTYISNATQISQKKFYQDILMNIINHIVDNNGKTYEGYNELIMNKFKILGAYSIEAGRFEFDKEYGRKLIESSGYKFLGHIDKENFKLITPELY